LNQNQDNMTSMEWTAQTFAYAPYTPVFNSTGQPAISLPLHWTGDGRPVGTQLVGHMGAEGILLNLAAQLETAADWRSRQQALITSL
jgi:amidase